MPARHQTDVKLPAVGCSSGHLVIERLKESGHEPDYPGKVFANPELSYTEAMQAFVDASQPLSGQREMVAVAEHQSQRVEIRELRREEAELCAERRLLRQGRKLVAAAWQQQRRAQLSAEELAPPKLRARWGCQRYKCMHCGSKYTPEPKARGYEIELRRKAIQLYVDGLNLRRIGRHLGIHHRTVSLWVNAYAHELPPAPMPGEVEVAELDELFTFIGNKKTRFTSSPK